MKGVWLDTPSGRGQQRERDDPRVFPHLFHRFYTFGIDITQEPVLIYPASTIERGDLLMNMGDDQETVCGGRGFRRGARKKPIRRKFPPGYIVFKVALELGGSTGERDKIGYPSDHVIEYQK